MFNENINDKFIRLNQLEQALRAAAPLTVIIQEKSSQYENFRKQNIEAEIEYLVKQILNAIPPEKKAA